MFKLIILAIGFVLGGGTGLWLSAAQPELAAKLLNKQNELIEEGKRQALEEVKNRLDAIIAKAEATPPKSTGTQILGIMASGGAAPETTGKKEVKELAADLDAKLSELKK